MEIGFVIPDIAYVGLYALFALIFMLFGILTVRKYRWQYALGKIVNAVLSALFSVLLLGAIAPTVGNALANLVKGLFREGEIVELLSSEALMKWASGLIGIIVSLLAFPVVFIIIKGILNLIWKGLCKLFFGSSLKPTKQEVALATENKAAEEKEDIKVGTIEVTETSETLEEIQTCKVDAANITVQVNEAEESKEESTDEVAEIVELSEENKAEEDEKLLENQNVILEEATFEEISEEVKPAEVLVAPKEEKPKKIKPIRRFAALCACLGALSGFLVFNFIFSPLLCFIADIGRIALPVLPMLEVKNLPENVDSICENAGVDMLSFFGGKLIYNGLSTFDVNGEDVVIATELEFIADAAGAVVSVTDEGYTDEEQDALIGKATESFEKTNLIPIVASELLKGVSESWLKGEAYFGATKPELNKSLDNLITEFLTISSESTPQTAKEDIKTILNMLVAAKDDIKTIVDVLSKPKEDGAADANSSKEKIWAILEKQDSIKNIIKPLLENNRLSPLVSSVANVGIHMMGETLGIPENDEVLYEAFAENISEAMKQSSMARSTTQNVVVLADGVKKAYSNVGITLPSGAEYTIAAYLSENLDPNASTDEIKVVFANENGELDHFFVLCSSLGENPTEEQVKEAVNSALVEIGLDGENLAAASEALSKKLDLNENRTIDISLKSAEDVGNKSSCVTLEDMYVDKKTVSDPEKEAENLAILISGTAPVIRELTSEENKNNPQSAGELMGKVGEVLDNLSKSEYLEGGMQNIITGTLQSSTVRDTLGLSPEKAASVSQSMANGIESGDSYKDHLTAIGKTVDVVAGAGASGEKPSKDDVKDLITNITPTTSDTVKELLNEEILSNNGIPENMSNTISDVFSSMLDEMAEINESNASPEYIEKEADGVVKALEIATTDPEVLKEGFFGKTEEEVREKVEEYAALITNSDIMTNVLIDAVYDDNGNPTLNPLGFEFTLKENERKIFEDELNKLHAEKRASGASHAEMETYNKLLISAAAFVNVEAEIAGNLVVFK